MAQPLIDLVNISKSFDNTMVLDDLNLSVKENSFVTLLGPSGCGKPQPCASSAALRPPTPERSSSTALTSASCRRTSAS